MRIVFTSDTHLLTHKIKFPAGDILCHSGDLTFQGTVSEITQELDALENLPFQDIILICGNHDWLGELNPLEMKKLCTDRGLTYLDDSGVTLNGIKFWGSPVQPEFCQWAFNRFRGKEIKEHWDLIPTDVNVLLTHGPVYDILDQCPPTWDGKDGLKVGCYDLMERVKDLKDLKVHSAGHIHHSYGNVVQGGVIYLNSSACNEKYKAVNKPWVVEVKDGKFSIV